MKSYVTLVLSAPTSKSKQDHHHLKSIDIKVVGRQAVQSHKGSFYGTNC